MHTRLNETNAFQSEEEILEITSHLCVTTVVSLRNSFGIWFNPFLMIKGPMGMRITPFWKKVDSLRITGRFLRFLMTIISI